MGALAMDFAPMVAAVFIAAQVRELQVGEGLPLWIEMSIGWTTAAILMNLLLVLLAPYCRMGESLAPGLSLITVITILYIYVGVGCVCAGLVMLPDAAPISPTMQCVYCLSAQFFLVFLFLWVSILLQQMDQSSGTNSESLVDGREQGMPSTGRFSYLVKFCTA